MPHLSRDVLEADPDGQVRLREILHDRSKAARAGTTAARMPSIEERFGVEREARATTPVGKRFAPARRGRTDQPVVAQESRCRCPIAS